MSKKSFNFKGLEKLNTQTLFCNGNNIPHTNGKLDIETLFQKKSINIKDYSFDSTILLNGIKQRKERLQEYYINMYKSCCDAITSANKSGITDILHAVPESVSEILDYDSLECMQYIKNKLNEQKISSTIWDKNKLFITWASLEKKINNERELLSKKDIDEDNDENSD